MLKLIQINMEALMPRFQELQTQTRRQNLMLGDKVKIFVHFQHKANTLYGHINGYTVIVFYVITQLHKDMCKTALTTNLICIFNSDVVIT